MEKDVTVEFVKIVATGLLKLCAYTLVVIAVSYGYLYFGVAEAEAFMYGSFTVLGVMFTYFSVDLAWYRAKRNVEYREMENL